MRLMIYDASCRGKPLRPGLTHSWIAGGHLYRALGRLDAFAGFTQWSQALEWVSGQLDAHCQQLTELQYWGHGKWGCALMGSAKLDVSALQPGHELYPALAAIRQRSPGPRALWWFRTCETFGAQSGLEFALRWSSFFDATVAGHTHIIGPIQSGLQVLRPACQPDWSPTEGLISGTPESPRRAAVSGVRRRHTIHCLQGQLPGYLRGA